MYKATDMVLQRPVALKMLHAHLTRDTVFMERFRNEAVLLARLNHPNVTTLYNFFQDQHESAIVMEWIDGVTVERLLRHRGRLEPEPAVRIVIQAIDGLHHAHSKGILHRDVKAANLMLLTEEGNIKLMDFGIAHLLGSQRLTRTDRVVGTLEYMAPELLSGEKPSVQSDLYAVGILLYELLTGRMPFDGTEEGTLITRILTTKPVPVRSLVAGVPVRIGEILDRLLQKKPERRFQTALELRLALAAVVAPGRVELKPGREDGKTAASVTAFSDPVAPEKDATAAGGFPGKRLPWKAILGGIRNSLLSLEGMILAIAAAVAVIIIGYGLSGGEKKVPELTGHPGTQVRDTIREHAALTEEVPDPRITAVPGGQVLVEAPPAVQTRKTLPRPLKEVESKPSKASAAAGSKRAEAGAAEEKKVTSKPVEQPPQDLQEAGPLPAKAKSGTTIELRGEVLSAVLRQTISSESAQAGQVFWLHTDAPVTVRGTTVIRAGAQVRGIVERVVSKSEGKRAGLWIRLEAVESVDGDWIPLIFKWSDTAFHPVELKQGFRFRKVRIQKSSVWVSR